MADAAGKTKIAILGGGVGAMTAAFELTDQPGWQDRYEITVYQLGWRLGGKGASGRNRELGDRIEEHGLHFWFGYYENAFNIIQRVYAELGRPPTAPLATWRDAFKPHNLFILMQFNEAQWSEWRLTPPPLGGTPGDGTVPTLWEIVDLLIHWLETHFMEVSPPGFVADVTRSADHPGWFHGLIDRLGLATTQAVGAVGLQAARELVRQAASHEDTTASRGLFDEAISAFGHFLERARAAMDQLMARAIDEELGSLPSLRRLLSLIELGFYIVKGIIVDDVALKGFDQLDHLDLREWLASHGAGPLATDSDAIRVAYESIFAFSQGSYEAPNLAAGTGLRGLLRLGCTYKEAFAFKMQAGMGDTIFGPFYEVLLRRGVTFEFFSNVRDVVPSADGTRIESLVIGRQATVKHNKPYEPLYDVKGLPCWPNTPFFEQLDQGDTLKKKLINLESYWNCWDDVRTDRLTVGVDFDEVILGTSLGPIPIICSKLVAARSDWAAMVANVEVIGTQAFQIWTIPDSEKLQKEPDGDKGQPFVEGPIYGGFAQPHNTISDMSHLLARENWPADGPPNGLFYFCGPLALAKDLPPPTNFLYPVFEDAAANVRASEWMRSNSQFLLPGSMYSGYPESFPDTLNFGILYDKTGPLIPPSLHFDAQYWRANIDPSERYVLSTKGSTAFRLRASKSGYSNLKLAGDWTFTGLNYGCVEAATMSGMEASRAICGAPKIIFGENFPKP